MTYIGNIQPLFTYSNQIYVLLPHPSLSASLARMSVLSDSWVMKRLTHPLEYPFVIKQVSEWITVSVPDLEITVADQVPRGGVLNKDYVTILNSLILKAARKVMEKMQRLDEINKKPTRPPSYIRQTIVIENKEKIPTRLAAKYLGISEATLKRWEAQGVVRATKTRGGHRSFNLGELDRVKEAASRGTKPLTPEEEDREKLRVIMRKVQK